MNRFATMLALCLLAGQAWSGTFELSDPAAEMYKEQQAQEQAQPQEESPNRETSQESVLCTVDTTSGACSCIDQVSARTLPLTREECVARVRKSLELQD